MVCGDIYITIIFVVEGCMSGTINMCVFGNPADPAAQVEEGAAAPTPKVERPFSQNAILLAFCFVGLQVSLCLSCNLGVLLQLLLFFIKLCCDGVSSVFYE